MQHSRVIRPHRAAPSTRNHVAAALSFLGLLASVALGACSEELPFCFGGYVNEAGECEGLCRSESCLEGNKCVNNRCVLECTSHTQCAADGTQDCAPAKVDDGDKQDILACLPNAKAYGFGVSCPFGVECGGLKSCPSTGTPCYLDQCGGNPAACTPDVDFCRDRANCLAGKCPDKTPCTVLTCKPEECVAPLSCLTSGEGDVNSYCTKQDCASDADCAGGYYCGVTRDPHGICNSMNPAKGDNGICGKTNEACIDRATIGATDSTFEGQLCILRKTCVKRETCSPCESDVDCSQLPNNVCIALANDSTKRCAPTCTKSADCGPSFECLPVDAAAPDGPRACHHRFGACVGTGKYCEPCTNDTDCGPLTGTSVCLELSDGSRNCLDLTYDSVTCTSDADCPASPSGKHAQCDTASGTCTAFPASSGKASCW